MKHMPTSKSPKEFSLNYSLQLQYKKQQHQHMQLNQAVQMVKDPRDQKQVSMALRHIDNVKHRIVLLDKIALLRQVKQTEEEKKKFVDMKPLLSKVSKRFATNMQSQLKFERLLWEVREIQVKRNSRTIMASAGKKRLVGSRTLNHLTTDIHIQKTIPDSEMEIKSMRVSTHQDYSEKAKQAQIKKLNSIVQSPALQFSHSGTFTSKLTIGHDSNKMITLSYA